MFFKTFRFHYKSPLSCVIWLADAKYYSQQLKVNLVFHHPSKSEGNKSWLTWDSLSIYLFAFSFHPSFSTDARLPLSAEN